MPRVTVTPGRNVEKPLVEIDPSASPATRLGLGLLRASLVVAVFVGLVAVAIGVAFLLLL